MTTTSMWPVRFRWIVVAILALLLPLTCGGCEGGASQGSFGGDTTVLDDDPELDEFDVDVSVFYDELAPHGRWVEVAEYGRCWHPYGVAAGWRPYTVGRWVYTDFGWTWYSLEPWGWATYHYGRWALAAGHGWVWVPGRVWGPAWVAWRYGGGYCGWAPLPPPRRFREGVQMRVEVDVYAIEPELFCFVEQRRICDPHVHRAVLAREQNQRLMRESAIKIRRTERSRDGHLAINRGVPPDEVERATGRKVDRARLRDAGSPDDVRRERQREADEDDDDTTPAAAAATRDVKVYRPKLERSQEPKADAPAAAKEIEAERKALAERFEQRRREVEQREAREREERTAQVRREVASREKARVRELEEEHRRELKGLRERERKATAPPASPPKKDRSAPPDKGA